MAAPRIRCAHCGEPFDRRQVTQSYCFKLQCRRARNTARIREWRDSKRQLEHARLERIRKAAA